MFLVPLSEFQIEDGVDAREGILVCNGHANTYVEPVMDGWFAEQAQDHHRQFQFMHLDRLVQWITSERLITDFKSVLAELGLKPLIGGGS
jgi:hypothetical protein